MAEGWEDVAGLEDLAGAEEAPEGERGALAVLGSDLPRTWLRPLIAKREKDTWPTPDSLHHI